MKSPEIKHDTAIGENNQQYQITVRTDSSNKLHHRAKIK